MGVRGIPAALDAAGCVMHFDRLVRVNLPATDSNWKQSRTGSTLTQPCCALCSLSAVRLSEVQKELASLEDQLSPLLMKYKQEKERLDTIRRLQNKRQELLVALEMAEQRQDLARIAGEHMRRAC